MMAFSDDGLSIITTNIGTLLLFDSYTSDMCIQSCGMSSYAREMIKLRADEELKDTIVVAMPKLVGERFNLCTRCVVYEWKPPWCSSCKVFGHVLNECPKQRVSNLVMNNPRQATRGVLVSLKVSFKSTKQIYRPISNKNSASSICKKKQVEVSREKVSKSNPFDALNSVDSDDHLDKIDKLESQILDGKLKFGDDDRNLLVPTGNVDSDSESEVEVVFDKTANLMASTSFKCGNDRVYDTNSLLEQWRETKQDDDNNLYDEDLYESHDMLVHLQAICDDLDITVHDRKKKYIILIFFSPL
ncbi:hypothetical protein Tco_0089443 [Tanacetum coccineum]